MDLDQNLCPHCRIFKEICMCSLIQQFNLKTRLTLLIHIKEIRRITNTGRLALYSLNNSGAVIKGDLNSAYKPQELIPENYGSILLTPQASNVLSPSFIHSFSKPINLIVPDGTWSQTRRLIHSEEKLRGIPHARLEGESSLLQTLRKKPHQTFLPTLGAIARAYGFLEGAEVEKYFEDLLQEMTRRLRKRLYRKNN